MMAVVPFLAFVVAITMLACPVFVREQAFATFRDVADSYPAAQELGSYGKPISGSELPDGAYQVGARTTSRMCILYTNPADAEARDSKEQAIVSVSGGSLVAVFYISRAYNYIYIGTQEQAAAATNKQGTDASAYIAGDPDSGYVPHLFTIPIPALNEPITIATYSGGNNGLEGGVWYTRQVVFTMSDAQLKQIKADAKAEEEAQRAQEQEEARKAQEAEEARLAEEEAARKAAEEEARRVEEESKAAEDEPSAAAEDEPSKAVGKDENEDQRKSSAESPSSSSSSQVAGSEKKGEGDDGVRSDGGGAQAALSEDNVTRSSTQESGFAGGEQAFQEEPSQELEQPSQSESSSSAFAEDAASPEKPAPMRGVRMNIVDSKIVIDTNGIDTKEAHETEQQFISQEQVIALLLLTAFAAGAVIRSALFRRALCPAEGLTETRER